MRKKSLLFSIAVIFLACFVVLPVVAQGDFTISMRRDFGYASGTGDIQGLFSITAKGPDDLARVVFMIDDQQIGEDSETPFKLQFSTDTYSNGKHTIYAIGYTSDGRKLRSNEFRVNFVPAGEAAKTASVIVIGALGLIVGVMVLTFVLTMISTRKKGALPLGTQRNYGLKGGAICKNCSRPFSLHIVSINLFVGVFDICPHCGKWQLARRTSLDMLRQAEQDELKGQEAAGPGIEQSEEEKLHKQLDSSRYE